MCLSRIVIAILFIVFGQNAFARKTNQAVYEEPFDLASGGASLTRATQEGVMFANPALMTYGEKFHRWLGFQLGVLAGKDSIKFVQDTAKGDDKSDEGEDATGKFVDDLFEKPIHAGLTYGLSYITETAGVGVFSRAEPDFEGKQFGPAGTPTVNVSAEIYAGAVASYSFRVARWFSLGLTAKYLKVAEPDVEIDLGDRQRIAELADNPDTVSGLTDVGTGTGYDIGSLIFLQGSWFDYRLAVKVDDVGGTKLSGAGDDFKQTIHVGTGITFHGSTEALHLSLDYRDVQGVYEELPFKRLYMGAKLLIRNMLGIGAGLYQGLPTYGVRLDLLLFKAGVTIYGREMGAVPGEKQRNIYVAYLGMGV
ncbi:MAG: hypothetical protein AB7T49_09825 [Oligoflexales bacterium]